MEQKDDAGIPVKVNTPRRGLRQLPHEKSGAARNKREGVPRPRTRFLLCAQVGGVAAPTGSCLLWRSSREALAADADRSARYVVGRSGGSAGTMGRQTSRAELVKFYAVRASASDCIPAPASTEWAPITAEFHGRSGASYHEREIERSSILFMSRRLKGECLRTPDCNRWPRNRRRRILRDCDPMRRAAAGHC